MSVPEPPPMEDELRELHRMLLQEAIRAKLTPDARRRSAERLAGAAPPSAKPSTAPPARV